ncbi:D-glycerate dehydrogenase [Candidatus Wolfebacteria bacterium]|nr:D-glycerate dehydrogenase [Candidatus Wolfebacteria bacterium]
MKILIAQTIPKIGSDSLKKHYEVLEADRILPKEELVDLIKDKDALICTPFHKIDSEILKAGKNLRVISTLSIGFEHIEIEAAGKLGIAVVNVPGLMTQTVAELVFAHILALARRVVEADNYIRSGKFQKWDFELMVGTELKGKTLGIIGFGSIGRCLVPIAKGFGMRVLYNNHHGEADNFKNDLAVRFAGLEELLRSADFIVLTVPLTNETMRLMDYEKFSMMKPSAFLVNASRGPVVKETDLIRALQEKKIAGAGLDVYEFEPKISEELLATNNTVLTPHIGGATTEARNLSSLKAAQNVIDILETGECENIVNREFLKL